jgi:hypothetical protein
MSVIGLLPNQVVARGSSVVGDTCGNSKEEEEEVPRMTGIWAPAILPRVHACVERYSDTSYEAIDNTLTSCLLSVETLERKLRSPNAILFGVAESLGEHQLTQVKSLLGDTSINDTIRLGKPSLAAPAPQAGSHQVFFHCSKACGF